MRTIPGMAARCARIAAILSSLSFLSGCGATAVVGAAASITAQAAKTTGKAVGTVARAGIGGVSATGRLVTRPFRRKDKKDEDDG